MPEQDDSTPPVPPTPPKYPKPTFHEYYAQRTLMEAAGKLSAIRADLWNTHLKLKEDGIDEDAIEEGKIPETLGFAIQGAIECVNRDNLDGAIKTLEETALLAPSTLVHEWKERRLKDRTSRGDETSE